MKEIRKLREDDIECRVQSVKDKGLILLLYKDARVDMNILDETFGAENWQREHYECKGNLFCRVGVKVGSEWIWKSDCGVESNTEAQKGEASDSFKRACFNWGIGRELYTAPFIWVPAEKCNITAGKCYDKFVVTFIHYADSVINALEIYNETKKCKAFTLPFDHSGEVSPEPKKTASKKTAVPTKDEYLKNARKDFWDKVTEIITVTGRDKTTEAEKLCLKAGVAEPATAEDFEKLIMAAEVMLGELYESKN